MIDFYPIQSHPWVVSNQKQLRGNFFEEPYFVEAYSASILLLRTRNALLKELQQHQALRLPHVLEKFPWAAETRLVGVKKPLKLRDWGVELRSRIEKKPDEKNIPIFLTLIV